MAFYTCAAADVAIKVVLHLLLSGSRVALQQTKEWNIITIVAIQCFIILYVPVH